MKDKHRRRSIRLQGYDYSQSGAYFITICTHNRVCSFGDIINGKMRLNKYGEITRQCWLAISNHFPHAQLDEFVIMPNHIHGIIILNKMGGIQNKIVGVQNIEPLLNIYKEISIINKKCLDKVILYMVSLQAQILKCQE